MHTATHIGLIVIFVVMMLPVYVMIAGWLFGRPREYRSVALTLGYMLGFTVLLILGLGALGMGISLVTAL